MMPFLNFWHLAMSLSETSSQSGCALTPTTSISAREGVEAPLFLSQLALADGNFTYGRYEEALAASERVLDLVQRQLPAWENMARSNRAHALLRLGRLEEAKEGIQEAIAASPTGADGWRWRIRCQALQMEIAVESGERWDAGAAEDLADLMLQSRFYHWAADILCAIAKYGKRKSAAGEAMGIAVGVGRPMTAARAASIGGLWREPAAPPLPWLRPTPTRRCLRPPSRPYWRRRRFPSPFPRRRLK